MGQGAEALDELRELARIVGRCHRPTVPVHHNDSHPSAVRPQQIRYPPPSVNITNLLTCTYLTEPTPPIRANAQFMEFGTKRSWVRIPPPRLV